MKLFRKAKAAVREHQRLSGAKVETLAGGIMANKPRYYQTAVHKNITHTHHLSTHHELSQSRKTRARAPLV